MTDGKTLPNPNDRSEPAKPEQSGQQPQQMQGSAATAVAQPGQRAAPGRRPLFRN
jgi:hypothetical protein